MNRSDLEQELREFLKFNSNDFMFINSSFLESMVLKERSYTLILFILNFLAVTITVLYQEVFPPITLDLLHLQERTLREAGQLVALYRHVHLPVFVGDRVF